MDIREFIKKVPEFGKLTAGNKIPYFAYYLIEIKDNESFSATDIKNCFKTLKIAPYSNISSYLSYYAKRKVFLKVRSGYVLERNHIDAIAEKVGAIQVSDPSDALFPVSLFDTTRTYLKNIARQAILSYDYGLYDASLVMIRKLLETLIIELFERHQISNRIKNTQTNNFYFLSELIPILLKEETLWNVSRNARKALPDIKEMGDMSAHNRRYNAQQCDIDKISKGLRVVVEELIHLIDYPTWNKER